MDGDWDETVFSFPHAHGVRKDLFAVRLKYESDQRGKRESYTNERGEQLSELPRIGYS